MLWLTRWFGVTGSDSERDLAREQSDIEEIVRRTLKVQATSAAAQQHRPAGPRNTCERGLRPGRVRSP